LGVGQAGIQPDAFFAPPSLVFQRTIAIERFRPQKNSKPNPAAPVPVIGIVFPPARTGEVAETLFLSAMAFVL
jgi:hypothetical protein